MGFLHSFVKSEELQKSWKPISFPCYHGDLAVLILGQGKQDPPPTPNPAVGTSIANALTAAGASQRDICSFASFCSAESNSAKWNFKKAVFVIFPELYMTSVKKKKKLQETTRKKSERLSLPS